MERGRDHVPLADRDDPPVVEAGEDVDVGAGPVDDRGPDEDAVDRLVAQHRNRQIGLERVQLATERVPLDGHVEERQDGLVAIGDLAGEDDHPSTSAEDRRAARGEVQDRAPQAPAVDQLPHRGRLAARDDQPGDPVQVGRQAHGDAVDADRLERREMLAERPLQRQDSDLHLGRPRPAGVVGAYQPLTARRSSSGIVSSEMPRIGDPRPFETSAMMEGLSKWVVAWTIAFAIRAGSSLLKMPDPTNTPSDPSCITSAASAGVEMPPATKFTTGSLPCSATSLTSSYGASSSLAATNSSSSRSPSSRRISASTSRNWRTASTTLPVPASPFVRIIAAPSLIRRSASPRFRQPHTNRILKACLSMWCFSSAGVRTSDSSM